MPVRRVERGVRGQQIGTIATTPKEIDNIIRKEYGKIHKGNGEKGEDPEDFAKKYMEDYKKYIYRQKEMKIEQVKGEDVEEAMRDLKETAGRLDQWGPADLRLLSKEACKELANFFNMIEEGAKWPKQLNMARAAFLAKETDSDMDPLAYRVLLMLPSVYRLWGKIRLAKLQPWIAKRALPPIYAGVEGQGPNDASYATAVEIEY